MSRRGQGRLGAAPTRRSGPRGDRGTAQKRTSAIWAGPAAPTGEPHPWALPAPPRWRMFASEPSLDPPVGPSDESERRLGALARAVTYQASDEEVELVNASLYLRRPLLITG